MRSDGFIGRRWHGRVPWSVLLWRDLLLVGSVLNLLASFAALALLASDVAGWVAVLIHLAPLPYNLFLLLAVQRHPQAGQAGQAIAAIWFVAMLVL